MIFLLTKQKQPAKRVLSLSGNNSVVECDLAKVEVAGSNPVSRSIFWRHSQAVRHRSAKPICSGSNPDAASIKHIKGFDRFGQTLFLLF